MSWGRRRTPYSATGILRLKCIRCVRQAEYQWQICADGNNFRPLCALCDVQLNSKVLAFMKDPEGKRKDGIVCTAEVE